MKYVWPFRYFVLILTIAVAVFGFGVWMAFDSMPHLNRLELRVGLFTLLFGPMAALLLLIPALNRFVPSERERLKEDRVRRRPFLIKGDIRNLEEAVRYARGMQAHPRITLFVCLATVLGFCGLLFAPAFGSKQVPLPIILESIGVLLGLSLILTPVVHAVISARWQTHFDSRIQKLERCLAEKRENQKLVSEAVSMNADSAPSGLG